MTTVNLCDICEAPIRNSHGREYKIRTLVKRRFWGWSADTWWNHVHLCATCLDQIKRRTTEARAETSPRP